MMRFRLLPVYSKLADPNDIAEHAPELDAKLRELSFKISLSQHQIETYLALTNPDVDVVINTAMTGDGKSLAAYLPTLVHGERSAFGMYPTNELARDQERQFTKYQEQFDRSFQFEAIWGAKLSEYVAKYPEFVRRAEALNSRLTTNQVILTNPDIFHLMLNYKYESGVFSNVELPYTLAMCYHDFIFDEFHIFDTPQMVSAITAMLCLCATANLNREDRPRFLFSSATPQAVFNDLLNGSGLRVKQIAGMYRTDPAADYRQVLHAADLHVHKLGERQNVEHWIEEHLDVLRTHWADEIQPRPRGVIIVNSVVEARRIARLLHDKLPMLKIGENTGLTDDERRREAMSRADLIVGTSTIDVGVDFNISLLIFEAPDAGTFLQRLGRLARYRPNEAFAHYEAHALFSGRTPWLYDKFIEALAQRNVRDGSEVDRPTVLRDAVSAAFPNATDFRRYIKRWGALQAAHVLVTLEDRTHGGSYDQIATKLRGQYAQALGLKNINSAIAQYRRLRPAKNEEGSTACKAILDEVLAFRGTSPFQVGVWDDTVDPAAFMSYDAFVIAQSADFCLADAESYSLALAARYPNPNDQQALLVRWSYVLKRDDDPLVLYVEAFRAEREGLVLQIDRFDPHQLSQVQLLKGLSIKQPRREEIRLLNAILRKQPVIGYITKRTVAELRRMLRLPAFFPLYQLEDSHERRYTLALGQTALLLEAQALWLAKKDEENSPIIL